MVDLPPIDSAPEELKDEARNWAAGVAQSLWFIR